MKNILNKLVLVLATVTASSQASPVADVSKLVRFGVKGGAATYVGYKTATFPENHPRAMAGWTAFWNAGSGQPLQPIQPPVHVPQSSAALERLAEGASALLPYLTKKNIAVGSIVVSTASIAYGYYKNERMRRWVNGQIDGAVDSIKDWAGPKFDALGRQITTLGTTLGQKIDDFKTWTASKFNRVESKLDEQSAQQQQMHQAANQQRHRIEGAINAGNQTTHQILGQVLQRLPQRNDTTMEEVE